MSEKLSGPVSVGVDGAGRTVEPNAGGSDQAATGAVSGTVTSAPVAADSENSPAGRPVDASSGVKTSVVVDQSGSSEAGENPEDLLIKWTEDPSLGEPQDPGVDKGAARRAGQGPDLADRSSVEAAGTGALPPALVPAAELAERLRVAERHRDSLFRRLNERFAQLQEMRTKLAWMTDERDAYQVEAESLTDQLGDMRAALSAAEAEIDRLRNDANERAIVADEWARAVAPLVPTDGAS